MIKENDYCKCEHSSGVHTDFDDFYQWDVCDDCNKPIEDTIQGLNHYDGEDHTFDY